jgi:hypothetical protein
MERRGRPNQAVLIEAVRALILIHDAMGKRIAASLSYDMRTPLEAIANSASYISMATDLAALQRVVGRIDLNPRGLYGMVSRYSGSSGQRNSMLETIQLNLF